MKRPFFLKPDQHDLWDYMDELSEKLDEISRMLEIVIHQSNKK